MATRTKKRATEAAPHAFDASRKRVEDAIIAYARSYASFCMKTARADLTERDWQRMLQALEQHEALIRSEGSAHD